MNYEEISKTTVKLIYQAYKSFEQSPMDQSLRLLIEIRVSQINGCAMCCRMHTDQALLLGLSQQKLDVLPAWRSAKLFSAKEIAALHWSEALTKNTHNLPELRANLESFLSEREIVDLTLSISLMNGLNRIAKSLEN